MVDRECNGFASAGEGRNVARNLEVLMRALVVPKRMEEGLIVRRILAAMLLTQDGEKWWCRESRDGKTCVRGQGICRQPQIFRRCGATNWKVA